MVGAPLRVARRSGSGGELPEVVDDDGSITRSWLKDLSLAYGQAEVKDCFRRYRVPMWLGRHFALPAGLAWVVNFPKLWTTTARSPVRG